MNVGGKRSPLHLFWESLGYSRACSQSIKTNEMILVFMKVQDVLFLTGFENFDYNVPCYSFLYIFCVFWVQ